MFEGEPGPNVGITTGSPKDDVYGYAYHMVRHCEACILVYDVTSRESLEELGRYYKHFFEERSLERNGGHSRSYSPPRGRFRGLFLVIANKIDFDASEWEVSIEEGEDFSARIGAAFFQMSAKTGEGVTAGVLADMASLVILRRIQNQSEHEMQEKVEGRAPGPLDSVLKGAFWADMRSTREYELDNYATIPHSGT